jgi:hypothetical protein
MAVCTRDTDYLLPGLVTHSIAGYTVSDAMIHSDSHTDSSNANMGHNGGNESLADYWRERGHAYSDTEAARIPQVRDLHM